eukprot:2740961-Pleurochrysis_carterae.AAC.1
MSASRAGSSRRARSRCAPSRTTGRATSRIRAPSDASGEWGWSRWGAERRAECARVLYEGDVCVER